MVRKVPTRKLELPQKKANGKRQRPATAASLAFVQNRSGRSLHLRYRLHMNREVFARLVPMSTRNLASIEGGKRASPTVVRRLTELKRVIDALSEVVHESAIGPWLVQPNPAFDGLKPIEVIERGEVDRIWQMIYFMQSGTPS